jgi:branched-subunit amino acid transport protein AzlD
MSVNKQEAVIAASVVTAIAGLLHLFLASQLLSILTAPKIMVFFLIAGLLQLFWVIPTIKQWSSFWNYAGIGGTLALIGIWSLTRFPNPIVGRALPVNAMGVLEETLQVSFIVLLFIVSYQRKQELRQNKLGQGV